MKKMIKIGALSIALIASLLILGNVTKAANWVLTLKINTGTNTCIYGTSLDLGVQSVNLASALTFSGQFTGASATFSCTSLNGANVSLTMQMSGNLTNATSNIITGTQVTMKTNAPTVTPVWGCTPGAWTTSLTAINPTAQGIVSKTSAPGQVCTVSANGVMINVLTKVAQEVWTYTGTLVLTETLNN